MQLLTLASIPLARAAVRAGPGGRADSCAGSRDEHVSPNGVHPRAHDQITILVSDAPDISGKPQRLDPNGDLRLPIVGRVHAAGLTLDQLEAELTTRLKEFMLEPDVAVTVTEFRSQPVSVIGAVSESGVRQLEGRKTLIEMLSLAGGVTADAGPTLRISRRLDQGPIPLPNAAARPRR